MVDSHKNVKWFAKHDIFLGPKNKRKKEKKKKVRIRIALWI
jgi:hypothetical protein